MFCTRLPRQNLWRSPLYPIPLDGHNSEETDNTVNFKKLVNRRRKNKKKTDVSARGSKVAVQLDKWYNINQDRIRRERAIRETSNGGLKTLSNMSIPQNVAPKKVTKFSDQVVQHGSISAGDSGIKSGVDPELVSNLLSSIGNILGIIANNTTPIEGIYRTLTSGQINVSGASANSNQGTYKQPDADFGGSNLPDNNNNIKKSFNASTKTTQNRRDIDEINAELVELTGVLAEIAKG